MDSQILSQRGFIRFLMYGAVQIKNSLHGFSDRTQGVTAKFKKTVPLLIDKLMSSGSNPSL